jgi:hypothetical protein
MKTTFNKQTFVALCLFLMKDESTSALDMKVIEEMLFAYCNASNMPNMDNIIKDDIWSKFIDDLSCADTQESIEKVYNEHFEKTPEMKAESEKTYFQDSIFDLMANAIRPYPQFLNSK